MGCMIDTNYRVWNGTSSVVGWPQGNPKTNTPWAYQKIAAEAAEYAAAGFTAIRFPPSCVGGAGVWSAGYDKYDDYDLDGTAFGDAEMLRQAIASAHAHGIQAYGDLVLHQYGGGRADGTYATKRFPKTASCFVGAPPRVAIDPVPDVTGDFAFGDMCSYANSTPPGYMYFGAIAAAQWLTKTVDFDGYRVDDVKGTYAPVVAGILNAAGMTDLFAVGEYFDGNPYMVGRWVNYFMNHRSSVLDFAFKFNVGNICNNNSKVWMGQLSHIGWCNDDASSAVTFVESADTDNSPGEQIIWNKMLGYAIMLTFPGYPCVYYRDWSTDHGCYGLKDQINNLIWIHEHLAQGDFVPRLDDHPQVFVHERLGYQDAPGCIAAFNNDQYHKYTVTVQTRYQPNTRLHEYTGHYDTDVWTDSNGCITITLPENVNGLSYLVFGLWITPPSFSELRSTLTTTQTFYGANDLKLPAAVNGQQVVGGIFPAVGTKIEFSVDAKLAATETLTVTILDPTGNPLTGNKIINAGRHEIILSGTNLPDSGVPYEVVVTYTGV